MGKFKFNQQELDRLKKIRTNNFKIRIKEDKRELLYDDEFDLRISYNGISEKVIPLNRTEAKAVVKLLDDFIKSKEK
jgi:hypothetical protein